MYFPPNCPPYYKLSFISNMIPMKGPLSSYLTPFHPKAINSSIIHIVVLLLLPLQSLNGFPSNSSGFPFIRESKATKLLTD